jgi:hypothetical protein
LASGALDKVLEQLEAIAPAESEPCPGGHTVSAVSCPRNDSPDKAASHYRRATEIYPTWPTHIATRAACSPKAAIMSTRSGSLL